MNAEQCGGEPELQEAPYHVCLRMCMYTNVRLHGMTAVLLECRGQKMVDTASTHKCLEVAISKHSDKSYASQPSYRVCGEPSSECPAAVLLSCCPAGLLSCCPVVLLACCPAVLLSCCPAVLLSCCPVVLLSCCPAGLLSCCPAGLLLMLAPN